MTDPQLVREVEAIVFAAEHPVTLAEIARHVSEPGDIAAALADLAASYAPRGIVLVERGGRWLFQTAPDLGHVLRRIRDAPRKLSRAAVETLAIIAYHEPATRAEIEDIRGVAVSPGTVDVLMAAGWVRPAGRRESPGRPLQFATTPGFLADFGLSDRRDLPGVADLRAAGLLDRVPPGASTGEMADAGLHSER
ncbi:SMC-Scp complex subunit ScpB [Polymorphobacter sp. PAMC 29334]|uniref:SMC-Scp complex subunit ScpB n=1 Tax=Polymorphobacter sp. PAMC 29334 TaxID=2862331 RepID=UPI001C755706|nr:SMC-Scp complex subunit ScpB [Polymorphobacter sp. PAMC 29334]QYE35074.1 SMC-Scp complex subunit ScpB [Polymorphobacter sp. PAMC 29334]